MAYIPDNLYQFSEYNSPVLSFNFDSEIELYPTVFSSGEECVLDDLKIFPFKPELPFNFGLCDKELNWEYNNVCTHGNLYSGENTFIEFTQDKNYEYNFTVCDLWDYGNDIELSETCGMAIHTGQSCEFDIITSTNYEYDFDICGDGNINVRNKNLNNLILEYNEICEITYRMESIYSGQSITTSLEFENILIEIPGINLDNKLKLFECTPNSTIQIETCKKELSVSGKNHQFNITLCNSETNPQPIDIVPHTFSFNRPWNYICSSITIAGATGESASATILGGLKLPLEGMYSGESSDLTNLGLDISFTNMKGYTGEEVDADFFTRPFVVFDIQNLSGESAESDIYRSILFGTDITYTGEEVDAGDLETIGPINPITDNYTGEEVDADFATTAILNPLIYSGQELDADLKIDPLIELENPTMYTGEEADSDMETFQAPTLTFDSMYSGETGSSYLNVTYVLSSIGYTGEQSGFDILNLDTVFDVIYYTGEEADFDMETNSPDDMEPNVDTGEYVDSSIATSLILFPRTYTGEYSFSAMTTIPAIYFDPKSYTGERAEIDELIEETEYYIAIGGEYSDAGLSREISFTPNSMWAGEEAKTDAINLDFTIFDISLFAGEQVSAKLETIAGPSLSFDSMWAGEYAESDTGILYYPIFILDTIISSQVMYDGLGGAGGLNFCYDCCPIPNQFGGNDDPLIFDVRPQDREPWGRCGPNEDTQFHTSLTARIRFEPVAYHGEYVKSYIDKEYMAFGEMEGSCDNVLEFCEPLVCIDGKDKEGDDCVHDDLYWLYNRTPVPHKLPRENNLEPVITTGERSILWWEPADDYVSRMEQKFTIDLTIPSLVDTFYTGEDFIVSLSYDESDWKYPFKRNRGGQLATFDFEANENMRFCPGYLIPKGDNVIFDFASPIFTECFGYFAKTGEMLEPVDLLSEAGMTANGVNGQKFSFQLTIFGPWQLTAVNGQAFTFDLSTTVLIKPYAIKGDQTALAHLYCPPTYWSMGCGEMARLAQLDVSLPGIRWITEGGCIENIYNPLTEGGDIDLEYENFERCVEFMPYLGKVNAVCDDSVYIYHIILRPEMMANNFVVDKISFATEKLFNLECNTGEYVYLQEYAGEDGAEINADLEIFPVIPLDDFNLIQGDQNVFATLNTTNTFEFELYSSEEADAIVNGELVLEFG